MAPSSPSGRESGSRREDRSPDLRLLQPPSQKQARAPVCSGFLGSCSRSRRTRLNFFPHPMTQPTVTEPGALTVAGQWRSYTAFPSILAIKVVNCTIPSSCSRDVIEQLSMTSTFIAAIGSNVKTGLGQVRPPHLAVAPSLLRERCGDPGLIRTADLRFRKPMLYPAELRGHLS